MLPAGAGDEGCPELEGSPFAGEAPLSLALTSGLSRRRLRGGGLMSSLPISVRRRVVLLRSKLARDKLDCSWGRVLSGSGN